MEAGCRYWSPPNGPAPTVTDAREQSVPVRLYLRYITTELLGQSLGITSWTRYPTSTLTTSWRRLQNNFSLPELQCFISDSQLTRDAALHLRLGDRRSARAQTARFCSRAVAFFLGRRRSVSLRHDLPPTLLFPCLGALCD